MGKYDVRAQQAAQHFAKTHLPHKVYRQLNQRGGFLRSHRIAGVREISTSKDAKKVINAVLDEASKHELFTAKEERQLRRKAHLGHRRHMENFLGVKEQEEAAVGGQATDEKTGATKSSHRKPPSAADGKRERLTILQAQRAGASEEDIEALRKENKEIGEKELRQLEHKQLMRRLVKEAHGWKKDEDDEEEDEKKKHQLGHTPEAAAREIGNRQVVQRPPEIHGPPPPPS